MSQSRLVPALAAFLGASCGGPPEVAPFSNDPLSVRQGYMPALGVPEAWRVERGRPDVVVAVVDNGFDLTHPDLAPQLWTNPEERPDNGVDDDHDGYIDDVHGWNFLGRDARLDVDAPSGLRPELAGHGTSAAGIVAARTDNGVGVAGCCPGCRLMLLKARDFGAARTVLPRLAEAITYAARHGARVVSVSDGVLPDALGASDVATLDDAVRRARERGVLVVASAGNDGVDAVRWPARLAPVLAVAAVDWEGVATSWTTYGAEVDVAAPGVDVYAPFPGGTYGWFQGTSAAAPVVAGLAGLLFSAHPTWNADDVEARILATARPARGRPLGAGVVDFAAALGARAR